MRATRCSSRSAGRRFELCRIRVRRGWRARRADDAPVVSARERSGSWRPIGVGPRGRNAVDARGVRNGHGCRKNDVNCDRDGRSSSVLLRIDVAESAQGVVVSNVITIGRVVYSACLLGSKCGVPADFSVRLAQKPWRDRRRLHDERQHTEKRAQEIPHQILAPPHALRRLSRKFRLRHDSSRDRRFNEMQARGA